MDAHWREIGAHLRVVLADTTAEDAAKLAKAIADSPRAMTQTEVRNCANKMFGRKYGSAAYAAINGRWSEFGLKIELGSKPSQRFICAAGK